jgi:GT2 family glycosyltransferase
MEKRDVCRRTGRPTGECLEGMESISPKDGPSGVNDVKVIIVNWNGKKFLPRVLEALKHQTFKRFSTLIVDNGSTDGSLDLISLHFPEVDILSLETNTGFSAANNLAIKSVSQEYIALLNNDAVPHPGWLRSLVDSLQKHPQAGIAASKMLFFDFPGFIDRAGDGYTTSGTGLLRGRGDAAERFGSTEWVFGACAGAALFRTSLFQDVGLFDEDFFLIYEDVDLSFRAQLKGYKCLYVPEAVVYHKGGMTIGHDSPVSVYYGHRNLEWVYIQNMPGRLIRRTVFNHLVYDAAAFFYFAAIGRHWEFLRAKWDALKGLKKALSKREKIQREKRVSHEYIWSLLENEALFSRLVRRFHR